DRHRARIGRSRARRSCAPRHHAEGPEEAVMRRTVVIASLLVAMLATGARGAAAADDERDLVVVAGRPLHVTLDRRTAVKRVGQPITGTLADAVFVYDRLVIP